MKSIVEVTENVGAVAIQRAFNKREDRRLRNLTNKANGGFNVLQHGNLQAGQNSR